MAVDDLLEPPSALIQGLAAEPDDVKRVHHRDGLGELFGGGGLEAGEPVHRHHLDGVAPGPRPLDGDCGPWAQRCVQDARASCYSDGPPPEGTRLLLQQELVNGAQTAAVKVQVRCVRVALVGLEGQCGLSAGCDVVLPQLPRAQWHGMSARC